MKYGITQAHHQYSHLDNYFQIAHAGAFAGKSGMVNTQAYQDAGLLRWSIY